MTFVVTVVTRDKINNLQNTLPPRQYRSYRTYRTYISRLLLRDPLELDKPAQLRDHHSFFTFQPARKRWSVAKLVLALQVIPNLAVCTLTVPTKIAVRDRVDGQVLKTTQQAVLLGNAHFVAQYVEIDELLVGIEQV